MWGIPKRSNTCKVGLPERKRENGTEAVFEDIILRILQNDESQQLTDSKNLEHPKQDEYRGNESLHINIRLWKPVTERKF